MDPIELLIRIIQENTPASIAMWHDSLLERYRYLGNTNRGEIGEQFVRQYLTHHGIPVGNGDRTARTDMEIAGHRFEVKTASLGANGTFQFNHLRYDREYRYLLCLGICPNNAVFNMWRRGELTEGVAGRLVRMAEGQAVTFKLTKKLADMHPIEELPDRIRAIA